MRVVTGPGFVDVAFTDAIGRRRQDGRSNLAPPSEARQGLVKADDSGHALVKSRTLNPKP